MITGESQKNMIEVRAALPFGWSRNCQSCITIVRPPSFRSINSVSAAGVHGKKTKGDQEGSLSSSHRQEQHQEYHKISTSWNVPRTSLSHYPEEAQHVIRNNLGRKSRRSSSVSRIKSEVDKILQVLQYEASCGFANAQGKSGQCFSQWLEEALQRCSKELSDSGFIDSAHVCLDLSKELKDYDRMSQHTRKDLVLRMEMVATTIGNSLQPHPHAMRSTRYINLEQRGEGRPEDIQAEEAHEEETLALLPETTKGHSATLDLLDVDSAPLTQLPTTPKIGESDSDYTWIKHQRKIKPETIAFRESFAKAALAAAEVATSNDRGTKDANDAGKQRTSQWFALRERRLTASAFSKALGFFDGDRNSLWEEKVGLKPPFGGNEATQWGTKMEARALDTYQTLTGQQVEGCMFRVKHDDPPHSWLGASPDGLMGGLGILDGDPRSMTTASDRSCNFESLPLSLNGPGILEIKCPYNRGHPENAVPPSKAIWYYMPQLQGLMDIFDREWCVLYVWTVNHGSAAFLITRDRDYWAAAFAVLAEFWWSHVVPARQAYEQGASTDEIESLRPPDNHPVANELRAWSKRLANAAPAVFFRPSRTQL